MSDFGDKMVTMQAPYGTYRKLSEDEFKAVIAERDRLKAAIVKHRSIVAEDRCTHIDDDDLYAALGDGIKVDRRVGDKVAMIRNCVDFVEKRCDGGGWISYATLRKQRDEVIDLLQRATAVLSLTCTDLTGVPVLVLHINQMCDTIDAADKEAAAGKIV